MRPLRIELSFDRWQRSVLTDILGAQYLILRIMGCLNTLLEIVFILLKQPPHKNNRYISIMLGGCN